MNIFVNSSLSSLDKDFINYYNRVIANGGNFNNNVYPTGYNIGAINQFFIDLKLNNLWDKLQEFALIGVGVGNLAAALTKCKILGGGSIINNNFLSTDLISTGASLGLAGDGINKYLDADTNTNLLTQDNSCFTVYVTNSGTNGIASTPIYSTTTSGVYMVFNANDTIAIRIMSGTSISLTAGNRNIKGLWGGTRENSTLRSAFNRSTRSSGSSTSITPTSAPLNLFRNPGGTQYWDGKLSFYSLGFNLSSDDTNTLSNLLNNLHAAFGFIP